MTDSVWHRACAVQVESLRNSSVQRKRDWNIVKAVGDSQHEKLEDIKKKFLELDPQWYEPDKYCKANSDLLYDAMTFISNLLEIDKEPMGVDVDG